MAFSRSSSTESSSAQECIEKARSHGTFPGFPEGQKDSAHVVKRRTDSLKLSDSNPSIPNAYLRFASPVSVVYEPLPETTCTLAYMRYRKVAPHSGHESIEVISEVNPGSSEGTLTEVSFSGECWKLTELKMCFVTWFDRRFSSDLAEQEWIYPHLDMNFSVRLDSIEQEWCPSPEP